MSDLNQKQILIVGATGDFGKEFARQLTSAGAAILGTASSAESSARLAPNLAGRFLLDLNSEESIAALATYLLETQTKIDGVILASGLVAFGTISDTPAWVSSKLHQVNAVGQISLISKILPALQESGASGNEPFVVSISGVIAEMPMAGLSSYSSSKTAIKGFAEAASKELRKSGIRWVDARPGHTESGLATRAIFGQAPNFGAGKTVPEVVTRIVTAIKEDEKDLPSTAF
jgi:cyclic-di-GMP-binding biofilm dispersal mediator protein